jgi:hypothetical protein
VLVLGAGTGRATFHLVDRSPAPGETVDLGDIVLPDGGTLVRPRRRRGRRGGGRRPRRGPADIPAVAFTFGLSWLTLDGGLCFKDGFGCDRRVQVSPLPAWISALEASSRCGGDAPRADGAFRLEGVRVGKPTLWVRKRGLVPARCTGRSRSSPARSATWDASR